jgi:Cu-Zn family superoxide dismutase
MKRLTHTILLSLVSATLGCATDDHRHATHLKADGAKVAVATLAPSKAATTQPTMNNVRGTVTFSQVADGVAVIAEVTGLPPNSKHGFHVHEKGDLSSPDLMSTGPHWDPHATHVHGAPATQPVHAGDMGNLTTDGGGTAKLEMTIKGITIDDPQTGVVGRAVIVHAKPDDYSSQPSGNAGARVAGGLIEAKK